jgi:hypothetical protein
LTDLTGFYPGHEGFYIQAFSESVTFLAAGHHYDSLWTLLSVGLSPTGTSASFAAPDPYKRVYTALTLDEWRRSEHPDRDAECGPPEQERGETIPSQLCALTATN